MAKNQTSQYQHKDVRIISEKTIFSGFFNVVLYKLQHRLFQGGWSNVMERLLVKRRQAVAAIPYDPKLDRVVLLEQFRIGAMADRISPWMIEMPAGIIDNDDDYATNILRELNEEAGIQTATLHPIYDYFASPGASNEQIILYCAIIDAAHVDGIHGEVEENEDIKVHNIPFSEAVEWLTAGKIKNGIALVGMQWLLLNHDMLRKQYA